MAAYACADLHFGHKQIHIYRNFDSVQEHDDYVEARWRDVVRSNKRDTTYVLGDIAFTREGWERFDSLPGSKIVILGNHCTEYETAEYIAGLKTVNSVHSLLKYKSAIMSHAPLHPDHLRGKRNIHGHLHGTLVHDQRYLNVSLENLNDYAPVLMDDLWAEFERRRQLAYVYKTLGAKTALNTVLRKCRSLLN